MLEIPLIRPDGEHRSLDGRLLSSYRGEPVARVSVAPPALVQVDLARLSAPGERLDPIEMCCVLERAGQLLASIPLGGIGPEEHCRLVTLATGIPLRWSRHGLTELADGLRAARSALAWQVPGGDLSILGGGEVRLPGGRCFAWVPAGRLLGVIAPSNHPSVHLSWALALAMGYRVIVKPGADDPLTPYRLALALREAGLPVGVLAVLPAGHEVVPLLCEACDRVILYGTEAVTARWAGARHVLANGPGRSKAFVDLAIPGEAPDLDGLVPFLAEAVLHHGGRKCTALSGIVVRGPTRELTGALAERLAAVPALDPLDPGALLPAWKVPGTAAAVSARIDRLLAAGAGVDRVAARLPGGRLVQKDGLTLLRPALIECPGTDSPLFGPEYAFPCAAATPAPPHPLSALRGSLAVTLLTGDEGLVRAALADPSIHKVFVGLVPPYHAEPGAPHHGRLGEFLHTSKAFVRAAAPGGNETGAG